MIEITYKKGFYGNYDYNVGYLKKYGDRYKVQVVGCVRKKGVKLNIRPKGTVNDKKDDCNIRRAKNRIKEVVLCNDWDYFMTLTLDKRKYDRYNLPKYIKDLSQFIRDLRKKLNRDIKYLLVPEMHKDGAWHMHGFIKGLCISDVELFKVDSKIPFYIKDKLEKGQLVYRWLDYEKKFGFCDLEPIRDKERASSYVTKYVTKDLGTGVTDINAKMYYSSRGLEYAKTIKKGDTSTLYSPDYIKHNDDGQVLYSEMWLPPTVSDLTAKMYIQNNTISTDYESIVDADGVLICDVPTEWL